MDALACCVRGMADAGECLVHAAEYLEDATERAMRFVRVGMRLAVGRTG
jgi:hypothetical protein